MKRPSKKIADSGGGYRRISQEQTVVSNIVEYRGEGDIFPKFNKRGARGGGGGFPKYMVYLILVEFVAR